MPNRLPLRDLINNMYNRPGCTGRELQRKVLERAQGIASHNRPYVFDGVGDCWGFVRQVWNAILSDGSTHPEDYSPCQGNKRWSPKPRRGCMTPCRYHEARMVWCPTVPPDPSVDNEPMDRVGIMSGGLLVRDSVNPDWVRITDRDLLMPGDALCTEQGHRWGDDWHGGIYAGKENGVHKQWDCADPPEEAMSGAHHRNFYSEFKYYYKPLHDLLARRNDAVFIGQSVPNAMSANQLYTVQVKMQNIGECTWTNGSNYRLGSHCPKDTHNWGHLNRIMLPHDVRPGQQVTFSFQVHAPAQERNYDFQWRMVQDGVEWFGSLSTNHPVHVFVDPNDTRMYEQGARQLPITPPQNIPAPPTNLYAAPRSSAQSQAQSQSAQQAAPLALAENQPEQESVALSPTEIQFTWMASPDAEDYYLDIAESAYDLEHNSGTFQHFITQRRTTVNWENLKPATTYFWRVLGFNALGQGAHGYPQPRSITTPPLHVWGGSLDHVDCATIRGWAWDGGAPDEPVDVDIYADGIRLATVQANIYRQDLQNTGHGDGRHAFAYTPPESLFDDQTHFISVRIAGSNYELPSGDRPVTVRGSLATYTATVRDAMGNGLAGATVTLFDSVGAEREALTGSTGVCGFADVLTGNGLSATLRASKQFYNVDPPLEVTVTNDLGPRNVVLNLRRQRFSVSGLIVGENGQPIPNPIPVDLVGSNTQTASTGTDAATRGVYRFDNVPAGRDFLVKPRHRYYTITPESHYIELLYGDTALGFSAVRIRRSLKAVVTDDRQTPRAVVGAELILGGFETRSPLPLTDANGEYTFTGLRAGRQYSVEVRHPHFDFTPAVKATDPDRGAEQGGLDADTTFTFAGKLRKYDVTVFIEAIDGGTLRDATIAVSGSSPLDPTVVYGPGSQPPITLPTPQQDSYTVRQLPAAGDYTLAPSHPLYDFDAPATRTFNDLDKSESWTVVARRRLYAVGGYIKDAFGVGLGGVTVKSLGQVAAEGTTRPDGRFDLNPSLDAGFAYRLQVNPPPAMSFEALEHLLAFLDGPREVNFKGGYTVSGFVKDRNGHGIGGVTMSLNNGQATRTTPTEPGTGKYEFKFNAPGRNYTLTPAKAGMSFVREGQSSISITNLGGNFGADFLGGHTISGQITDDFAVLASPLSGLQVALTGSYSATAQTESAAGQYTFKQVPPGGSYTVTPSASGSDISFNHPSRTVSNLSDHQVLHFKGGYTITGQVLATTGAPLPGVTMQLTRVDSTGKTSQRTVVTDAQGQYVFDYIAPSNYTLTATKAGVNLRPLSATNGLLNSDLVINYAELCLVKGMITASDGTPLSDVTLQLTGPKLSAESAEATSDDKGNYSFAFVPQQGDYTLIPSKPRYVFTPPTLSFSNPSPEQTIHFGGQLIPRIGGMVTNNGDPLGGVTVELTGTQTETTETTPKGFYSFDILPRKHGSYTVTPRGDRSRTFRPESRTFETPTSDVVADFALHVPPTRFGKEQADDEERAVEDKQTVV